MSTIQRPACPNWRRFATFLRDRVLCFQRWAVESTSCSNIVGDMHAHMDPFDHKKYVVLERFLGHSFGRPPRVDRASPESGPNSGGPENRSKIGAQGTNSGRIWCHMRAECVEKVDFDGPRWALTIGITDKLHELVAPMSVRIRSLNADLGANVVAALSSAFQPVLRRPPIDLRRATKGVDPNNL